MEVFERAVRWDSWMKSFLPWWVWSWGWLMCEMMISLVVRLVDEDNSIYKKTVSIHYLPFSIRRSRKDVKRETKHT